MRMVEFGVRKAEVWIVLLSEFRVPTSEFKMEDAMPYDPEKDKVLKKWKCEGTGLVVSINQYGGGEAKLQVGPRILVKKDGTEGAPVKAGRLSTEDFLWLYDLMDELKDELTRFNKPE
jgi:hypothetical protein